MTDKEKLQRLFDAALKDSSQIEKSPTRLFPKSSYAASAPAPMSEPVAEIQPEPMPVPAVEIAAPPAANFGLDDETSTELARLLDAQTQRKASKLRRDALITFSVCFALAGGSFGWFVQSPQRVQAFHSAVKEIRSVGDIASILSKYQKAVDKVGARSNHVDEATESMGMSSSQEGLEDPNLEAEMLAMTGGEGKSVGQRNEMLRDKFGKIAEAARAKAERETAGVSTAGVSEDDSLLSR